MFTGLIQTVGRISQLTVRPDGMISLPVLHDVPAAGLTPEQVHVLGAYVLNLLDRALTGCRNGEFAAMATAPAIAPTPSSATASACGRTASSTASWCSVR